MSRNIQLRIAESEDIPFLHKTFNNPDVMDYWFNEPYKSMESLKEEIEKRDETSRLFILTNDAQEQIGIIAFYFIDQRHRHAEFAIALDPLHQGKGYATTATKLALDYAFKVLNFYKVYLIVAAVNEKASYVYEKVGFEIEGRQKRHYFINGKYHDAIIMGIFSSDYLE